MKVRLMLVMMFVIAANASMVFATEVSIFDAVHITESGPVTSFEQAVPYGEFQVYLSCPAGAISTLTGGDGGLIVDNFLTINGSNVFGGTNSGFAGVYNQDLFNNLPSAINQPVELYFTGVGTADVSGLVTGTQLFTFNLMDFGYTYGNSEVNLVTTCTVKTQVCHRNNGNHPGFKTLSVGAASIPAHLGHGDTLGPCGQ